MSRGLILFAHGARNPSWSLALEALAAEVRQRDPAAPLRLAYLELLPPDLGTALAELAPQCRRVDVFPIFWASNGHLMREVPALVDAARSAHPGLEVVMHPPLSELPGMLGFLAQLIVERSPPAG